MQRRAPREGFTLIELLVAIGIIAVLTALTMTIGPVLNRNQQAGRGAEITQGALFIAKQTALRDRNSHGIRLMLDSDGMIRSMQYITQPLDYVRNRVEVKPAALNRVLFASDISDGLGTNTALWPVQAGDYIQIQNSSEPKRIVKIISAFEVETLSSYALPGVLSTSDFRIMRSARPAAGEDLVLLPDDVIIDPARSRLVPDDLGRLDVMFSAAGPVTGNAARLGKVILWVRNSDPNFNPATGKEQSLIVVTTRSGSIGSYEVNTGSGDPYLYTFDSRPTGF